MPQSGHCSWSSAVGASWPGSCRRSARHCRCPDQIDIMIWPPMARLRKMSRCEVLDEERDADLAPVIGDEFQHVGFQRALAGRLDDDLRPRGRPAAGECRRRRAWSGPSRRAAHWPGRDRAAIQAVGVFRLEERALRQHRVGAFLAQPVEHRHVDLAPVDGERQRAAEAHVAQDGLRQTASPQLRLGRAPRASPASASTD